jgi:hypothetical protein
MFSPILVALFFAGLYVFLRKQPAAPPVDTVDPNTAASGYPNYISAQHGPAFGPPIPHPTVDAPQFYQYMPHAIRHMAIYTAPQVMAKPGCGCGGKCGGGGGCGGSCGGEKKFNWTPGQLLKPRFNTLQSFFGVTPVGYRGITGSGADSLSVNIRALIANSPRAAFENAASNLESQSFGHLQTAFVQSYELDRATYAEPENAQGETAPALPFNTPIGLADKPYGH